MPNIQSVIERLHQPLWAGWRLDQSKDALSADIPLTKEMNLFVGGLGNRFITNMMRSAGMVADRSGLIRRIGIFASFDSLEDYEEFWSKSSFDLNMGGRTFHTFDVRDVETTETTDTSPKSGADIPVPTHKYGFMGWITLEEPLPVGPRMSFHVLLRSSDKLVKAMEWLRYSPSTDFAAITFYLDTDMTREVL